MSSVGCRGNGSVGSRGVGCAVGVGGWDGLVGVGSGSSVGCGGVGSMRSIGCGGVGCRAVGTRSSSIGCGSSSVCNSRSRSIGCGSSSVGYSRSRSIGCRSSSIGYSGSSSGVVGRGSGVSNSRSSSSVDGVGHDGSNSSNCWSRANGTTPGRHNKDTSSADISVGSSYIFSMDGVLRFSRLNMFLVDAHLRQRPAVADSVAVPESARVPRLLGLTEAIL